MVTFDLSDSEDASSMASMEEPHHKSKHVSSVWTGSQGCPLCVPMAKACLSCSSGFGRLCCGHSFSLTIDYSWVVGKAALLWAFSGKSWQHLQLSTLVLPLPF